MTETDSKAGKVTTSDIARLSGVSRSTVSAVLNGKRRVRESTKRKVLECIHQQKYTSGIIAKSMVRELSRLVAVLAPSIGNPYHMMFFRGLNQVLNSYGYHIIVHSVLPEDQEDISMIDVLSEYHPAGCIILRGAEGPEARHAQRIVKQDIPVVSSGPLLDMESHFVCCNDRAAIGLATEYAYSMGHRRFGYIAGPVFSRGAKERKLGFLERLIHHEIPISDVTVLDAGETAVEGYQAALGMLKDPATRPTVVLCFNDMVAMGVYRATHELGLDIPSDISVIGFDGIDFVALFGPPLTTVNCFPTELGCQAAELLIEVIRRKGGGNYIQRWVEPQMLERGSVKRIPL